MVLFFSFTINLISLDYDILLLSYHPEISYTYRNYQGVRPEKLAD